MKYELLLSLLFTPKSGVKSLSPVFTQSWSDCPRNPFCHNSSLSISRPHHPTCSHFPRDNFVTAGTPFPYNSPAQLHAGFRGGGNSVNLSCLREGCIAKAGKKGIWRSPQSLRASLLPWGCSEFIHHLFLGYLEREDNSNVKMSICQKNPTGNARSCSRAGMEGREGTVRLKLG